MSITPKRKRGAKRAAPLSLQNGFGHAPEILSELLGQIYEGQEDSQPWATSLRSIQNELRASWVALMLRPATAKRDAQIVTAGRPVWLASESPYLRGNEIPPGGVFSALSTDRMSVVEASSAKPASQHTMGADILIGGSELIRLRVCRSDRQGPFTSKEIAFGQMLLPHFKRAVSGWLRQQQWERDTYLNERAIESLRLGIVTVSESGCVLNANRMALQFLRSNSGIRIANGVITCDNQSEDRKLRLAIQKAIDERNSPLNDLGIAIMAKNPLSAARATMLVKRVAYAPSVPGPSTAAAVVYIRIPIPASFTRSPDYERRMSQRLVRQLFALTPQESAMVLCMVDGATLDEAASALGIKRNTARTHLRTIFSKMDVPRQSSMVRVIASSVATMLMDY